MIHLRLFLFEDSVVELQTFYGDEVKFGGGASVPLPFSNPFSCKNSLIRQDNP